MIRIPSFWKLSLAILAAFLLNLPSVAAAQTKQKVPPALTTITAEFGRVMTRVDALVSQTAAEISDTDKGSPDSRQKVIELCRDLSLALYCAVTDADGTVIIGEPAETFRAEGINTLAEDHIRKALTEHRPVMSKLFRTARGPYAVSLAYPVRFRDTGASGALAVYFRPDLSIGAIVRKIPVYLPVEVAVIQTDGQIVYDEHQEAVGRNLLTDEEFQAYRQLVNLAWRAVKSRTGAGSYVPVRTRGQRDTKKVVNWDTVALYGTEWRVIMIRTEQADTQYGLTRPTQANLSQLDRALRGLCGNDELRRALSAGSRQRAMDLFDRFHKANKGVYSVQWIDASGVNRFGYPEARSLVDYNYGERNNPEDEQVMKVLRDKTEASFSRQLMEGGTGRFFFCPVTVGGEFLGTLYTIIRTN
jgi:hypothetical protein